MHVKSVLGFSFSELNVFSCTLCLKNSNWFSLARGWSTGRSDESNKLENVMEALLSRLGTLDSLIISNK